MSHIQAESGSREAIVLDLLGAGPLDIGRGIEKEGLRVEQDHLIAQSDHPEALGSTLTHPEITTDYSEALLELITPVCGSREELLSALEKTHQFVASHLQGESLWAGSMPCRLAGEESIRIAEYGHSNIGQLKRVYREGLAVRYGRVMQSIAGLHYNFSLSDSFWNRLHTALGSDASLQDFKSEQYFHLIRNFRRQAWLLMYLFGASPVTDKSFVEDMPHSLDVTEDGETFFKPHACSLRMGDLGYHNNAQASLNICFNKLSNFTHNLQAAIHTPHPPYQEIGLERDGKAIQINANILQIENEYYSSIRPKRTALAGERPTDALNARGVEYIEVRCLDLDPREPLGIGAGQIDFMDVFLVDALLKPSPVIDDDECTALSDNFAAIVDSGRDPALRLDNQKTPMSVTQWSEQLLSSMLDTADAMDTAFSDQRYRTSVEAQLAKINDPDQLPSAQIYKAVIDHNQSWLDYAGALSDAHLAHLKASASPELVQKGQVKAAESIQAQHDLEASDTQSFDEYLAEFRELGN